MTRLLAILPAAALLTSCSVVDLAGPRANGDIMELAAQARADAQVLTASPAARDLRVAQADQLVGEARRLCGTDPEGATPTSCDTSVDESALPAGSGDVAALANQVRAQAVDSADKVPASSVDLVVAQAIDAVALAPVPLDGIDLSGADRADLDAAREALRREYELEYGIGLATAWADEGLISRIDAIRAAADERRAALTTALEPTGDIPQPAAGYEFLANGDAEAPTDADSAAQLVTRLQADTVTQWRRAAAEAQSRAWRDAAIRCAAHAQRV